jgi:hypothetical protein
MDETRETFDHSATYSPDDDKIRISPAYRLGADEYAKVKSAGFQWAPLQKVFFGVWTPQREDIAIEMAGDIEDEDSTLVERAETRADRFESYEKNRAADAEQARKAVHRIADGIPFGQPILVGHHSERHARKDAERIENGMRKAVKMWETSKYWQSRASGAIRAAKYKELPGVRARRIKTIEAEQRKRQRELDAHAKLLTFWQREPISQESALLVCNYKDHGGAILADGSRDYSAWSALTDGKIDVETLRAQRLESLPKAIYHSSRWVQHCASRLVYETAMLAEAGELHRLDKKPRPTLLPLLNYRQAVITCPNMYNRGEVINYPQVEMTKAEYAKINVDYKGTRVCEGTHRIRTTMQRHALVCVFLTDAKVDAKPDTPTDPAPAPRPSFHERDRVLDAPRVPKADETPFQAMRESLRAGVQVVSAPSLFPTPPDVAARMVALAALAPEHRILEPSGGTARIILAIQKALPHADLTAVEIKAHLADVIRSAYRVPTFCKDFLECNGEIGTFDRILMNPPFDHGSDIRHIQHARSLLNPGGRVVAICADGPKQQAQLQPEAETWIELPAGTFEGTGVRAAICVFDRKGES